MSGSEARLVLFEDDVEDPVEAVFDAPMAAHGVGGGLGGEGRGGDIVSGVEAAAILELGARDDLDDGGDARETELAGKRLSPLSQSTSRGEGDAALLDAAMAFVEIGDAVEAGRRRVLEESFDLGAERRLVGLDGEQIIGPRVDDGGSDGSDCRRWRRW